MAKQGKQMRVGPSKGSAYHSVKPVLLANWNRFEVDFNTLYLVVKPSIHFKYSPVPTLTLFYTHPCLQSIAVPEDSCSDFIKHAASLLTVTILST
jgi:hypothetical protein